MQYLDEKMMTIIKENFYDSIKELIGEQNLSSWCQSIGFPRSTAKNWFHRGSLPSTEVLVFLSKKLNVSVDYLLGLET